MLRESLRVKEGDLADDPAAQFFLEADRFIEEFLFIRADDELTQNVRPIRFKLNNVQRHILEEKRRVEREGGERRYIILKSRKVGVTTLEQALSYHAISTNELCECVTLAHDLESTKKIFRIANLFDSKMREHHGAITPERFYDNQRQIDFPNLRSIFFIGTAGNKSFARGTTVQRVHGSEVAHWGRSEDWDVKNLVSGLSEAAKWGEVVLESTPKGMGGFFYNTWQKARQRRGPWHAIFIPWFDDAKNKKEFTSDRARSEFLETLTAEETAVAEKYKLSDEQLLWRRKMIEMHEELFWQEYPEDDITCFVSAGLHYFKVAMIQGLVKFCEQAIEIRDGGDVVIWEKPLRGHQYVIGADVGGGVEGGDFSCAGVLDRETCKQVAVLHGIWRPEVFADEMAKIGRLYNDALIACEANDHGHSTLNSLINVISYPNIYYHLDYDNVKRKTVPRLGWQTSGKTRPLMLSELRDALSESWLIVNDREFLNECMTFVDDGTGKYAARSGFYDDRIIAWAISIQARKRGDVFIETY